MKLSLKGVVLENVFFFNCERHLEKYIILTFYALNLPQKHEKSKLQYDCYQCITDYKSYILLLSHPIFQDSQFAVLILTLKNDIFERIPLQRNA